MGIAVTYTGINLGNVKKNNRSAILKLLNDQGMQSRKDIASRLGLTQATVSVICAELIEDGILIEMGEEKEEGKRAGRRKILLDINYARNFVLSVSIESAETTIVLSDMHGKSLQSIVLPTQTELAPEVFLRRIADNAESLLRSARKDKTQLLGVGVSLPGRVNRSRGISERAHYIWEHPVEVRSILQNYLGLPVIVENNVKAFAEAELIYGAGKVNENLLFVKWGPGVGAAIVIHKQIYEGRTIKSAEIGHVIVEPVGTPCHCGRRGCLETCISTHAIADLIQKACSPDTMPVLYQIIEGDLSRIVARTADWWLSCNDTGILKALEKYIDAFALSVANARTLLAPDQVILYGKMFQIPALRECFLRAVQEYTPSPSFDPPVMSELSDKISYIGPLAVVVNELFLSAGLQTQEEG